MDSGRHESRRPSRRWRRSGGSATAIAAVLAAVAGLGSIGCKTVPSGRAAVDALTIRGTHGLDADDVEDRLATTASPRFLGLFRGLVYEQSLFDDAVLARDLARIEAFYRSKGYYQAQARAGRIFVISPQHVRVEIIVEEGVPVRVREIELHGAEALPPKIVEAARHAIAMRRGQPFEEEGFDHIERDVRRALADLGYAHVKVVTAANVDIVTQAADLDVSVTAGDACVFGDVTLEGLGAIPATPVRAVIDIRAGKPYSEEALDDARVAISGLGVFGSVVVKPILPEQVPEDRPCVVPVHVALEPSPPRTLRLGAGLELDSLQSDIHGIVGWEDRNFLGGMRTFSATLRPGFVLYPLRINNLVAPTNLLPDGRLRIVFRQPAIFGEKTNAFIRPSLDVYAMLIDPDRKEDAPVIGYAESRGAIGLDRTFSKVFSAVSYNAQVAVPFAYLGQRDPTLGTLFISYPELLAQLDLRDDAVKPRRGAWFGATFQAAGGPFGGQADDVRIQPEVRGFVPLGRRVVIAGRTSIGLLWARNYGEVVRDPPPVIEPSVETTRDYQITFFRGFFSGGPSSNRGYPIRGIGPHAVVPFLTPAQLSTPGACSPEDASCRSPTGGFTLWEASVEARVDVAGPFWIATFCDASDVSPHETNFRFSHPHLSCGLGARYDTPLGPVRLDAGYRIPGLQVIGGLTRDEESPPNFLGIPIAVWLGIGEAY